MNKSKQTIIASPENKLSEAIKKELRRSTKARFATGWFFVSGLKELLPELDKLKKIEILTSPATNRQTAEAMLLAKGFIQAVEDTLEEQKYITPEAREEILENEANNLLQTVSRIKPTEENKEFLIWLFKALESKKVEIHIYTKEHLHAKMYLLDDIAFVGSSNLSLSGFNLNSELNISLEDKDNLAELNAWFKEKWEHSKDSDFTALARAELMRSWALNETVTPFQIYLRILHEIFSYEVADEIPELKSGTLKLYNFQEDAIIDAYQRLKKFNGVFIADVPGLGKTYTGSALLAHLQEDGKKALVICPPNLEDNWKNVLNEFNVGTARVISKGKLDQILADERLMRRDVVLIDEAHHFRNPETNLYKDLELICEGKQVILVGATPQNLSLWDIYHQIKLFHSNEISETLRIDPPSLKEYFKACEDGKADLEDLLSQILIRRTRKNVKDDYGQDIHFPKRNGPHRIDYSIDEVYKGGIYSAINKLIDELVFARYDLGSFIKEEEFTPDERQRIKQAGSNLRKIMRMILFKLLESSFYAFRESLNLIVRSHLAFLKGLGEGKVLVGEAAEDIIDDLRAGTEISDLIIPDDAYDAKRFDEQKLKRDINKDLVTFSKIYDLVKAIKPEEDEKLRTLIKQLSDKEIFGRKTIIFTQYATTAQYLGEELKKKFANVDYVSQGTGQVLTKAKRFSPKSNEFKVDKDNPEINILVSTELLSEGQNLQDGEAVINYELHWNPVRIIQRIGRIDRIGSENDQIWIYNFFPQLEAEREINVEKKVKQRINEINQRFGADSKTISEDEQLDQKKFYEMYTEEGDSLEEDEKESKSGYYLMQWKKLREQFQEEYQKAIDLPPMVYGGLSSHRNGVVAFCKTDDFYKLFLANQAGEIIERNDWQILSFIECSEAAILKKSYPNHLKIIEDIREKFEEEANEREIKKLNHLELLKRQVVDKLTRLKRGQPDKFKKEVDEVIDLVRNAKLSVSQRRSLRSIRSKYGSLPNELVGEVRIIVEDCPREEFKTPIKKYAEVIMSESLV